MSAVSKVKSTVFISCFLLSFCVSHYPALSGQTVHFVKIPAYFWLLIACRCANATSRSQWDRYCSFETDLELLKDQTHRDLVIICKKQQPKIQRKQLSHLDTLYLLIYIHI